MRKLKEVTNRTTTNDKQLNYEKTR